jgi:dTDP-4-dehydrorhamnose 3,5-epimerase
MKITETSFDGLRILEPRIFEDARGFFFESYNSQSFAQLGIAIEFVQDNQSRSSQHVIRGLHFQHPPHAQTKLVRVLQGRILDVVVDLRSDHPTFGKVFTLELSAENKKQLIVPKGFAHGFSVLSEFAEILYKCDAYYAPGHEGGIRFNDPDLSINWGVPAGLELVSPKDQELPGFNEVMRNRSRS